MKRNNSSVIILAILLSVAFYISGIPLIWEKAPLWSIVAAAVMTAATSLVLFLTNACFGSKSGVILPSIYIILSSVNPKALFYNPLHPASLAVAAAMFFCIKFFRESQRNSDAFSSQLFLGVAACFFPPAMWLFPLLFLAGLMKTTDTARFTFASLSGLLLPIAFWTGISYLTGGSDQIVAFLESLGTGAIAVGPKAIFYSSATIIRIIAVAAFAITALVSIRKSLLLFILTAICAIALLFFNNSGEPFCVWISLAVALPLNSFLADEGKRHRWIFILIFCFILIAERITYYL